VITLTTEQLQWLLDGMDIEAVRRHPARHYRHAGSSIQCNTKGEAASRISSPIALASKLQKDNRWIKYSVPKFQSIRAICSKSASLLATMVLAMVEGRRSFIGLERPSSGEWRYRIGRTICRNGHCR
jgi:hypothetical protein